MFDQPTNISFGFRGLIPAIRKKKIFFKEKPIAYYSFWLKS